MDIIFPNLGIELQHIDPVAFTIFGIDVYWYGIIICTGIIAGLSMAMMVAKRTKQDPEIYTELLIYALILAIIGARVYYVIFSFGDYKDNLLDVFNFREGGLAIYGGVIGAVLGALIFAKRKKKNFWLLVDTGVPGLILGQAIGRWGNFFNMEAFGGQTDNLFAMALNVTKVKYIPDHVNEVTIGGMNYLQVHPTFLYESLWCLVVLALLLIATKYKKFNGEIFFLYLFGYSLGRLWIEGLRTDQLLIGNFAVSQLLAGLLVVTAATVIISKRLHLRKGKD